MLLMVLTDINLFLQILNNMPKVADKTGKYIKRYDEERLQRAWWILKTVCQNNRQLLCMGFPGKISNTDCVRNS